MLELFPRTLCEDETGYNHFNGYFGTKAISWLLLNSNFKNLRRLAIGGIWSVDDARLKGLIDHANTLPKLQELVLESGRLTQRGILALAEAGWRGQWKRLVRFEFDVFEVEDGVEWDMDNPFLVLSQVWPYLSIEAYWADGKEASGGE